MNKSLPIGFFDSGVGGLSVLARFEQKMPLESTIYYGDLKNLPYGSKTKSELIGFAKNILDFFKKQNVKAVVIACNTSSALAYESIKDLYDFKIYPIIQSCAKVISQMDIDRIGVFATQGTVNSGAYKKEILKYNSAMNVCEIACPNWVNIVEKKDIDVSIARQDIDFHVQEMMEFNPDKIVLGCTHYPYLINELSRKLSDQMFIDPAEIFVDFIHDDLAKCNLLNNTEANAKHDFYVSASPKLFVENASLFYNLTEFPKVV